MPTRRVRLGYKIYFSRNWYVRLSACLTLLTIYKGFYLILHRRSYRHWSGCRHSNHCSVLGWQLGIGGCLRSPFPFWAGLAGHTRYWHQWWLKVLERYYILYITFSMTLVSHSNRFLTSCTQKLAVILRT